MLTAVKEFAKEHASGILITIGIFGYASSMCFGAKAYEECKIRIAKRKAELETEKLPAGEMVKTIWKPLILPTICFATSTACVLGSQSLILKKNAALALAYKGAETALAEFKEETKKAVGEEVYNDIREKVAEKQIERLPAPELPETYLDETPLWYDGVYGGYFYKTTKEVCDLFSEVREELKNGYCGDRYGLGDLYFSLHDEPLGMGDKYAYFAEDYIHNKFEFTISSEYKTAPNGRPAKVIFYPEAREIKN